jgi:hypothetical protein
MINDRKNSELAARLAQLPREMPPARDPWPQIAERIEAGAAAGHGAPARGRWGGRFLGAMAASVMVAFAAGWLIGQRGEAPVPGAAGQELAGPGPWQALMASSEAEYEAAFREFLPVGEVRHSLPYQAVFDIEQGWAILKATEDSLKQALEQSPSDPYLVNRLMDLRARQLDFLRQLAELDQDNRRTSI